jgi:hypothetical protein
MHSHPVSVRRAADRCMYVGGRGGGSGWCVTQEGGERVSWRVIGERAATLIISTNYLHTVR